VAEAGTEAVVETLGGARIQRRGARDPREPPSAHGKTTGRRSPDRACRGSARIHLAAMADSKHGFESRWGHQPNSMAGAFIAVRYISNQIGLIPQAQSASQLPPVRFYSLE